MILPPPFKFVLIIFLAIFGFVFGPLVEMIQEGLRKRRNRRNRRVRRRRGQPPRSIQALVLWYGVKGKL